MKLGDTIKIIADKPAQGQSSIAILIGLKFPVVGIGRDGNGKPDGTVSVNSPDRRGEIVLQRDEWEAL